MLDIVPIPAFRDNYIWALCRGDLVAVVDPGDDEPVRRFLVGKRLAAILITHHHQDHVGAQTQKRIGWSTPVARIEADVVASFSLQTASV